MNPLLELSHVSYSYHELNGETLALSDISFSLESGSFLAIVGPSGCGNAMVSQWKHKYVLFPHPISPSLLPSSNTLSFPKLSDPQTA